jgi:hypothetical protein
MFEEGLTFEERTKKVELTILKKKYILFLADVRFQ